MRAWAPVASAERTCKFVRILGGYAKVVGVLMDLEIEVCGLVFDVPMSTFQCWV